MIGMQKKAYHTRKLAATGARRGRGRPPVGPGLRIRVPPWVFDQLTALQASRGPGTPMAGVFRDSVIAGLLSFKAEGIDVPGFDPGKAMLEAQGRGEPLGVLM